MTTAARPWIAVHPWRVSAVLLVLAALGIATVGGYGVTRAGTLALAMPMPLALLCPVIAGVGVAVACAGPWTGLADPARAKVARAAWVGTGTAIACASQALLPSLNLLGAGNELITEVGDSLLHPWAVVRNVLLCVGLALGCVVLGRATAAWLPPVLLVLCSMQFGMSENGSAGWAMMTSAQAGPGHLLSAAAVWALAVGIYVLSPEGRLTRRIRPPRDRAGERGRRDDVGHAADAVRAVVHRT